MMVCHLMNYLKEKLGEILLSLSYFPANNTLAIGVVKVTTHFERFTNFCKHQARNLKAKDINGKSGSVEGLFLFPSNPYFSRSICETLADVWGKESREEENSCVQV